MQKGENVFYINSVFYGSHEQDMRFHRAQNCNQYSQICDLTLLICD